MTAAASYLESARAFGTLTEGGAARVRLEVHDASRLEWTVGIPLPASRSYGYRLDVAFELPATAFVPHDPWSQLQSVTRLDGDGNLLPVTGDDASLDALRRGAVFAAQKLARAHDGFARHALLAGSLAVPTPASDLLAGLVTWLTAAQKVVDDARASLLAGGDAGTDVAREKDLADEYVSTRFIEMLAGAERSLTTLEGSRSPHLAVYTDAIESAEDKVADALERELGHRAARGYVCADADRASSLEAYVDRASQLKKHFHEVLFLERECFEVAQRIHHWVAALVAVIASTWAFAWQIALAARAAEGTNVGPRVLTIAALAGIVYATKDRIKEIGRTWISGHVHRLYAQRVVRLRAPARRTPGRDVIAVARETFDRRTRDVPDPLHPGSGAVVRTVMLQFRHVGEVHPNATLAAGGARQVKHVFRYDFSPLFARLGDAVTRVAVLDERTRRLSFREAPRCYRIPVRLAYVSGGARIEEGATLVLSKRGLERLEPQTAA